MSKIRGITLPEFEALLHYAQQTHEAKNEPIPQLQESQIDQIDSCLKTPFQTFGGRFLYKGFLEKAAILFYLINKNHALSNGNKRMACLCLGYFFEINGKDFLIPADKFYELAKTVVESNPDNKDETIKMIKETILMYM